MGRLSFLLRRRHLRLGVLLLVVMGMNHKTLHSATMFNHPSETARHFSKENDTTVTTTEQDPQRSTNNYDWIPQNFSEYISKSFPACAGSVNKMDIINTINQPPWNDMDWEHGVDGKGHAACGYKKCFLYSRSDSSSGYLLSIASIVQDMMKTNLVQKDLHESLGAHTLEIPGENPLLMNLSMPMACFLEEQSYQAGRKWKRFPNTPQMAVQKVKRAPEPYVLIGTNSVEGMNAIQEWGSFLKIHHANATAAYQQVLAEVRMMEKAMEKYPGLFSDWQVLVDLKGNFIYVDVDRIFTYQLEEKEEKIRIGKPKVLSTSRTIPNDTPYFQSEQTRF